MASYRPVVWQKLAMDNTAESLVVGTADDEEDAGHISSDCVYAAAWAAAA